MRTLPLALLSSALLLAGPLASQGDAPASPLVIKTSYSDVAFGVADGSVFEIDRELPDLARGEHYVMTLDDGGRMHVGTEQGNAGLIRIHARPSDLVDLFAQEVASALSRVQGIAVLVLGQQGMKATDAIKTVRAAFDLPTQVDVLTVKITGDPERPEDGYDASAEVTPVPGTWLDELVESLRQSAQGVPMLDSADSVLTLAAAVECDSPGLLEAFFDFFAMRGAKSTADAETYRGFLATTFECMSGEMGVTWSPDGGGMVSIASLRDADRMKKLQADAVYQKWGVDQAQLSPSVYEAELEAAALDYRGVQVSKTTMMMDVPVQIPLFEDGEMVTYTGIAGDYSLSWMFGADEDDVKQLIDTVLGQQLEHSKLPAGTLCSLTMRIAEIADFVAGGMIPTDQVPELFEAELGKAGRALTCSVRIR